MKRYIELLLVIIIFSCGVIAGRYLFPQYKDKIIKPDPKIVYIKGEATTDTIIKYIPKETNPQTGQKENTDIQADIAKPSIDVKINGKEYSIIPDFSEDNLFDNGKIVFNQSSKFDLDIKIPEQKRGFELGGYIGTDGLGAMAIIPRKNRGSYIPSLGTDYNGKYEGRIGITW